MNSTVLPDSTTYTVLHTSNRFINASGLLEEDGLYKLADDIRASLAIIILITGTFGNILAFMVMRRKSMRSTSAGVYFAMLALADTFYLYLGLVPFLIDYYTGLDIRYVHHIPCRVQRFLQFVFGDIAIWLLCAVTCDRFIAVILHTHAKKWCTPTRAKLVCFNLSIMACAKNLHIFWTRGIEMKETPDNGPVIKSQCGYPTAGSRFFEKNVRPWIVFALIAVLPTILILTLNIIIIKTLWKLQSIRSKHKQATAQAHAQASRQSQMSTSHANSKGVRQMTLMFLAISCMFLVLVPPGFSVLVIRPFVSKSSGSFAPVEAVLISVININHSINFYLYCLTGKGFRKEVLHIYYIFTGKRNRIHDESIFSAG